MSFKVSALCIHGISKNRARYWCAPWLNMVIDTIPASYLSELHCFEWESYTEQRYKSKTRIFDLLRDLMYAQDTKLRDDLTKAINSLPDTKLIIAHSWGTVILYYLLLEERIKPVDYIITMGSPLYRIISDPIRPKLITKQWFNLLGVFDIVNSSIFGTIPWAVNRLCYNFHDSEQYINADAFKDVLNEICAQAENYSL